MKNNYSYFDGFTEDQFAANYYFRKWVLYGEIEESEFWDNYLDANPHRESIILRARKKVEDSPANHAIKPLTIEEKLTIKHSIYQQINQPVKSFRLLKPKSLKLLRVAAILSGITMATMYFLNSKPLAESPFVMYQHTGVKEIKEIILPDSTVVILNAGSSLTYNSDIGSNQNREIRLEGNAYFKVKKKTDHRSFTVHTNSISIAVLGTEFNVDARSKATAIVLTNGKVRVSADNHNTAAVYMSAGEKVELDTLRHSFIKSKTNTLLYSAWTEGRWDFSSTSLLDITNLIHEYYGIETVFATEKMKRLKISAVIPVTDLASFSNILSKTLNINITEQHNQLQIQF
ncbi:MAG: FecR family protein [Ferruginibacter sp.]